MRARKLLTILAILFLLSPLACPLMAAPKSEHSSHDCNGEQQEQENHRVHSCCDQQAIIVEVVQLYFRNFIQLLPQSDSAAATSVVVQALQDFAHLYLKTGDLLAKLSILRT